jgi:hypothetical protein
LLAWHLTQYPFLYACPFCGLLHMLIDLLNVRWHWKLCFAEPVLRQFRVIVFAHSEGRAGFRVIIIDIVDNSI